MRYLCLVYHEEEKLAALSQDQLDALVSACSGWIEDLGKSGHHVFSAGLQSTRTAMTVRQRNGRLLLTGGPFAETKEFLGGFTLIDARDLNEALQLASKFPAARLGSLEVRPLLEADGEPSEALDRRIATAVRKNVVDLGECRTTVWCEQQQRGRAQSRPTPSGGPPRYPQRGEDAMQVLPYLNFDGRCEEALEFYRGALGAEVTALMRFKDSPQPCEPGQVPPGAADKVMHASFRIGQTTVMASDCHSGGKPNFQGFSLSLTAPDVPTATRLFGSLSDGGKVQMPLSETFFSPSFGVVADRFGVSWMIYVAP